MMNYPWPLLPKEPPILSQHLMKDILGDYPVPIVFTSRHLSVWRCLPRKMFLLGRMPLLGQSLLGRMPLLERMPLLGHLTPNRHTRVRRGTGVKKTRQNVPESGFMSNIISKLRSLYRG